MRSGRKLKAMTASPGRMRASAPTVVGVDELVGLAALVGGLAASAPALGVVLGRAVDEQVDRLCVRSSRLSRSIA